MSRVSNGEVIKGNGHENNYESNLSQHNGTPTHSKEKRGGEDYLKAPRAQHSKSKSKTSAFMKPEKDESPSGAFPPREEGAIEKAVSVSPNRFKKKNTKSSTKRRKARFQEGSVWASLEADGDLVLPTEISDGPIENEDDFFHPQSAAFLSGTGGGGGRVPVATSIIVGRPTTATVDVLLCRIREGSAGGGRAEGELSNEEASALQARCRGRVGELTTPSCIPCSESKGGIGGYGDTDASYALLLDDNEVEQRARYMLRQMAEEEAYREEQKETQEAYCKTAVSYRSLKGLPPPTATTTKNRNFASSSSRERNEARDGSDSDTDVQGAVDSDTERATGADLLGTLPYRRMDSVVPLMHKCDDPLSSPPLSASDAHVVDTCDYLVIDPSGHGDEGEETSSETAETSLRDSGESEGRRESARTNPDVATNRRGSGLVARIRSEAMHAVQ